MCTDNEIALAAAFGGDAVRAQPPVPQVQHIVTMRNADGTQYYAGLSWSHDYDDAHIFHNLEEALFEIETIKRECSSYEQGDYGVWQLKAREYEPRLKVETSWSTPIEDEDGYGGYYTAYTVAKIPSAVSDAVITELVREGWPATRCQHEYDCCGNYYASTADWSRCPGLRFGDSDKTTILIVQGFGQNV